jgi:hypothetical protein
LYNLTRAAAGRFVAIDEIVAQIVHDAVRNFFHRAGITGALAQRRAAFGHVAQ